MTPLKSFSLMARSRASVSMCTAQPYGCCVRRLTVNCPRRSPARLLGDDDAVDDAHLPLAVVTQDLHPEVAVRCRGELGDVVPGVVAHGAPRRWGVLGVGREVAAAVAQLPFRAGSHPR